MNGYSDDLDMAALASAVTDAVRLSDQANRAKQSYVFRCPCPAHDDVHPSANWNPAKGVWCCYSRHCERTIDGGGGTIALARLFGIDLADFRTPAARGLNNGAVVVAAPTGTPQQPSGDVPADLATFAAARGLDADVLRQTRGVCDVRFSGRPALRYPTPLGIDRVKFLDGGKPKYTWAASGGRAHWYGLAELAPLVAREGATVYVVNGEPAVWAAQQYGIAAVCMCVGEGAAGAASSIASELAAYVGAAAPVRVVYDADAAGRSGGRDVAAALAAAGIDAVALDIAAAPWPGEIPPGADVGDLAQALGDGLGDALAALPELAEAAAGGGLPSWMESFDDFEAEEVLWLWPGWIPLGVLCLLSGRPGVGKTTMTHDIAARVTRGHAMPNGVLSDLDGPRNVVILACEDPKAAVTKPRLAAAGADMSRCIRVKIEDDASPLKSLADIEAIRTAVRSANAALAIVDPPEAFLPDGVNGNNNAELRRFLLPLAQLAEAERCSIIFINHLRKSGGPALDAPGGSIAWAAAARATLVASFAPGSDEDRVLACSKPNFGPMPQPLVFRPVGSDNGAARIAWGGTCDFTADELTAPPNPEDRSKLRDAKQWLQDALADGPRAAKELQAEAKAAGITERTLRRAREELHVHDAREGGRSMWSLPSTSPEPPADVGPVTMVQVVVPDATASNLANLAKAAPNGHVGQVAAE